MRGLLRTAYVRRINVPYPAVLRYVGNADGPYTKQNNTTVFLRAVRTPERPKHQDPSLKDLALSFAAAQDCAHSAQPDGGSAKEDLDFFLLLWGCAVTVLEDIVARGSLPQEPFGWAIFGLSAGYIHPPAHDPIARNVFLSNKRHLRHALDMLPSLNGERNSEYVVGEKKTMAMLTRARKDIHLSGHILLHQYQLGNWRCVRWLHIIAIAERWIGAFGLTPMKGLGASVERMREVTHEEKALSKKKVGKKDVRFKFPDVGE